MGNKRWYINLPGDADKSQGERIVFEASSHLLVKLTSTNIISRRSSSRKVDWTLTPDLNGFPASLLPSQTTQLDHTQTSESSVGKWTNSFRTPGVTLVKYTATAQRTPSKSRKKTELADSVMTFRRVYYTVVCMAEAQKHWSKIEDRFEKAWSAVGYEFKKHKEYKAKKDEEHTIINDPEAGRFPSRVSYLYDDKLSHKPFHIRIVVVNDICMTSKIETTWELNNKTRTAGMAQIGSTGNIVYYRSAFEKATQRPTQCSVSTVTQQHIPRDAIIRISSSGIDIALAAAEFKGIQNALASGQKVSLKAKLNARKAKTRNITIRLNHTSCDKPIRIGTTTISVTQNPPDAGSGAYSNLEISAHMGLFAGRGADVRHKGHTSDPVHLGGPEVGKGSWDIYIHDTEREWTPKPFQTASLEVQERDKLVKSGPWSYDGTKLDLRPTATRDDRNTLRIRLPHANTTSKIRETLSSGSEFIGKKDRLHERSLRLALQLSYDEIPTTITLDTVVATSRSTEQEAGIYYESSSQMIKIRDPTLSFQPTSLSEVLESATLCTTSADVEIPNSAISVESDSTEVKFDLDNASLKSIRSAFHRGETLRFKATMFARKSLGGYCGKDTPSLAVLTTFATSQNYNRKEVENRLLLSALHEIGHAHGLAHRAFRHYGGDSIKTGATAKNAHFYNDDYGGVGEHCSFGAKLVPSGPSHGRPQTKSGQMYVHDKGKLCIMYHALRHEQSSYQFCEACSNALRLNGCVRLWKRE